MGFKVNKLQGMEPSVRGREVLNIVIELRAHRIRRTLLNSLTTTEMDAQLVTAHVLSDRIPKAYL